MLNESFKKVIPNSYLMSIESRKRSHSLDASLSVENESERNKKTRQIPHVAGNWPSFAYIKSNSHIGCN